MSRWRPSQDVRPVTEFRANAAAMLKHVQTTHRPVVLTQHGRSAAILLDVGAYETLLDELALLRDVKAAETQVAKGKAVPHATAAKQLRAKLVK